MNKTTPIELPAELEELRVAAVEDVARAGGITACRCGGRLTFPSGGTWHCSVCDARGDGPELVTFMEFFVLRWQLLDHAARRRVLERARAILETLRCERADA